LKAFAADCAVFERRNRAASKWFKFTSPTALTRWGYGTEEQARKYAAFWGKRTEFVEVDGKPEDDGATITNIGVALDIADA